MSTCCVCLKDFEGEDAPILMMDPSGTPLVLCPACAELVDAIAGTPDSPERREAVSRLADLEVENPIVAVELSRLVNYEDAPLNTDEGWEDENDLADAETPAPTVKGGGSSLYLYLGLGCLGVALLLYILLKLLG